ncbi:MAG: nucleic acid-binding protein [Anaerolineae bacterium]|nr:nucleic acid-binding protein [Anaerolineae bacterium]
MGAGSVSTAVADAGPLIRLHEIGALHLLAFIDQLHVPDAVWHEVHALGAGTAPPLETFDNLIRRRLNDDSVKQFIHRHSLEHLHLGEQESLYVCQEEAIGLLLTDDLAVRTAAIELNIRPVGSLGVIVRAYRIEALTLGEARQAIRSLQDVSSLFVTNAIVEQAILLLEEDAS